MILFTKQKKRPRHKEQTWTPRGVRGGGMNWETDIDKYILLIANLENPAVATALEKVSFHSNPKETQCQRMFKLLHNCIHLTH